MKIYMNKTVVEAALERIEFIYDEFPNVVVNMSGGKDSTVIFDLCRRVAEAKKRLPVNVMWIDQEAEWQATVDYMTEIMTRDDVKPYWCQMPMVITMNSSSYQRYAHCWEEGKDWIHPKHPISIKENRYNEQRFHKLFEAIIKVEFAGQRACKISGVRAEEARKRFLNLTKNLSYKWITWGKQCQSDNNYLTFYPIYDWSWRDVFKYIFENKLSHNRIYSMMYAHGVPPLRMRVSNVHHETALPQLMLMQELEPDTWNRIVERIQGAGSIKHLKRNSFTCPKKLPPMFKNWEEYAHYLIENIVAEDQYRKLILKKIDKLKLIYNELDEFWHVVINTILSSDWDMTKLKNFEINPPIWRYRINALKSKKANKAELQTSEG